MTLQANTRMIAVTGATGVQGGGVVNIVKTNPDWKIRAITRNASSKAAQSLLAEGFEVVTADYNDQASLEKAFNGVHAIFAVTNWWEHLSHGHSQKEASGMEEQQGMNLARAAAATPTLQHYIWSSTPHSQQFLSGPNAFEVPHIDSKANIDARIKKELPALAAITTYLYFGWYPSNMAFFPQIRPFLHPTTNVYTQILPVSPHAKVLVSGDMSINPGLWVQGILASGSKAYGKYSNVALERLSFQEMLDGWAEVTGKESVFVQTTVESFTQMWGTAGNELGLQSVLFERCDPWIETKEHIGIKDLAIAPEDVVGFRKTIEGLRPLW
ncbi:NAD(P)-binding protein [Polyplosphaeria fusca]|uniref:NAD(P)-binding protein n=1 Tax=Polyplosphaeria fusca TaxID=682080 RepID=A0A9P4QNR4_9PLEO|nr:NAD(P)-binding protein [Polyplosphaeria fusca]